MKGCRPFVRVVCGVTACAMLVVSVAIIFMTPSSQIRVGGLVFRGTRTERGVLQIGTPTGEAFVYALSDSLIDRLLTGDRHLRAARVAIDAWRDQPDGGTAEERPRWTLVPLMVDTVVLVGGWQVLFTVLVLLGITQER